MIIAYRTSLPVSVPPGGRAVILADGRVAGDGVQGPGDLLPARWANEGKHLEAIVFPAAELAVQFDVPGLRSAEEVALSLTVTLALRLDNPARRRKPICARRLRPGRLTKLALTVP
ncbi:MAG: hypothetical protein IPO15_22020 [Anaerolineae bacterium]|uniref:hypothetical protein n=1 Tax=Candidatus Amarolinea dominans TaxID=3140696 RepID=UPI0031347B23|nr:hypothetical protein [Anaerolineae bacterium]